MELTIEKQVENIIQFKKLIDEDPTNDFYLYPFMSMALNLTDKVGFLTEIGFKTLFNEINLDFDIINNLINRFFKFNFFMHLWFIFLFEFRESAGDVFVSWIVSDMATMGGV